MNLPSFVIKNLLRKPVRLILTVLPMCLAFVGFNIIIGIHNAYDVELELDEKRRLVTINRQSIIQPLMQSSIHRIRELPQVTHATYVTWFGGYFEKPEQVFSQYAVEPESYFAVFDSIRLSPGARDVFLQDPRAVLITEQLATQYQWQEGQKVTLTSNIWSQKNFSSDWTFTVAGIYQPENGTEDEVMLMKHDFLDKNRLFGRGMVSFFVSRTDTSTTLESTITTVDALFENSSTPTFTSKESVFAESFRRQLGDLALMTKLVLSTAIVVVFLLTSSSMAQSIVERKRELAILNAIGFSKARISALLLGENIMNVLIAMLISVCITIGVSLGLSHLLTEGPFSDIELRFLDLFKVVIIAIALGALGALIPLLQLLRKDLAANLKSAL